MVDGTAAALRFHAMPNQSFHLCGHEVQRPGHVCAFFSSREEEYATLLPFLSDGVAAGDQLLNLVGDVRIADHRTNLEAAGVPLGDAGVRVRSAEATYLADGHFDVHRMGDRIRQELDEAAAKGRGARAIGWMNWIDRKAPGTDQLIEYEARINLLAAQHDCALVCVYDRQVLNDRIFIDIMATHPYVILNGQLRKNAFYIPPEVYLKHLLTPRDKGPVS